MPYKDRKSTAARSSRKKAIDKWKAKNLERYMAYRRAAAERVRVKNKGNEVYRIKRNQSSARSHHKYKHITNPIRILKTKELDDWYVVKLLNMEKITKPHLSRAHPQIIEAKKITLKIKRKIYEANP